MFQKEVQNVLWRYKFEQIKLVLNNCRSILFIVVQKADFRSR